MARARILKPQFFANDELGALPPLARLLFQGLWCIADREGRLEDRPIRIKAEILPYDNADADKLLRQLHDAGFIQRYSVDAKSYIQIPTFLKHQRPHIKEQASTIPAPTLVSASTDLGSNNHLPETEGAPSHLPLNLDPLTLNLDPLTLNHNGASTNPAHSVIERLSVPSFEKLLAFKDLKGFTESFRKASDKELTTLATAIDGDFSRVNLDIESMKMADWLATSKGKNRLCTPGFVLGWLGRNYQPSGYSNGKTPLATPQRPAAPTEMSIEVG